mmetsp:Transcript_39575/g.95031  ORF Transcript_39575/g.95031 Transcript_39575/m.95031 type:complete len:1438 (+) Transcript_39575:75-4388(+)
MRLGSALLAVGSASVTYPYVEADWAAEAGVCGSGKEQSPVDLTSCTGMLGAARPPLETSYSEVATTLQNHGHAIQVTVKAETNTQMLTYDGVEFKLLQVHFHAESEHTIDGDQKPLEAHFVHRSDSGSLLVRGLMFEVGAANPTLEKFMGTMPGVDDDDVDGPTLNMDEFFAGVDPERYWSLWGSLTTPPCSEGVRWHVHMDSVTLSQAQLDAMKAKIGVASGNFRPAQSLNGRKIWGCDVHTMEREWYPYDQQAWAYKVAGSHEVCTNGMKQSPIDLSACAADAKEAREALAVDWPSQTCTVTNNGHGVVFTPKDGASSGKMTIGHNTYSLVQCHLHTESEHEIDGVRQAMELHCVHSKDGVDGQFGVLGIFFKVGTTANPLIAAVEDKLPPRPEEGHRRLATEELELDLKSAFTGANLQNFWSYDGSFTTPPCTEAVDWNVLMDVQEVTQEQLDKVAAAIGWNVGNFRPPKPLNGRVVAGCHREVHDMYQDEWEGLCKTGQEQSPIDLQACTADYERDDLTITSGDTKFSLANLGHAVQMNVITPSAANSVVFRGITYHLHQIHWHAGSENRVGGEQLGAEAHMVHVSADGQLLVVGVLFEGGAAADNPTMSFLGDFPEATHTGAVKGPETSGGFLLGAVNTNKVWSWWGSLTTPPCTEGVSWHLMMDKIAISDAQLAMLEAKLGHKNARDVQATNGRDVLGCEAPTAPAWYPYSHNTWSLTVEGSHGVCKVGMKQSPIDLSSCDHADHRAAITTAWPEQDVELTNNGHSVVITPKGATTGGSTILGAGYTLVQCHMHAGSEHYVDGVQKPLELHCVHSKDGVADHFGVIGVFFKVGATENAWLKKIEDSLPGNDGHAERRLAAQTVTMDLSTVFTGVQMDEYWTYDGSFTTPPCTEAVDWVVMMTELEITQAQLDKVESALGWESGNFRPPQPLNGRVVDGCAASWYPYDAAAWGGLCETGKEQSPIDLSVCTSPYNREPLAQTYAASATVLHNTGHSININFALDTLKVTDGGKDFFLIQTHYHVGSENTINGTQYAAEGHMVHASADGSLLVRGILYSVGAENAALAKVLPTTPAVGAADVAGPELDPTELLAGTNPERYWSWWGSLTTPPCSEGVRWQQSMDVLTLSQEQLDMMTAKIGVTAGNFRPAQPLNDRALLGCEAPHLVAPGWYPYDEVAWAYKVAGHHEVCHSTVGLHQSPIDLTSCSINDQSQQAITVNWPEQNWEIAHDGHSVKMTPSGTGDFVVGGQKYNLVQCHLHAGSEHFVDGAQKPLELHCVHSKDGVEGKFGVIGILFKVGAENAFIKSFEDDLPSASHADHDHRRLSGHMVSLKMEDAVGSADLQEYWSYDGSFTTPPCTEAVDWFVMMAEMEATQAQVDKVEAALGSNNFRPPQPLHNRTVAGCAATGDTGDADASSAGALGWAALAGLVALRA